jgi:hypothetical protein
MPGAGNRRELRVMASKSFVAVLAAAASMVAVEPAGAYSIPFTTSVKSGTTTMTSAYAPVNFDFRVLEAYTPLGGTEQKSMYDVKTYVESQTAPQGSIPPPTNTTIVANVSLTLFLTGSWEGVGYGEPGSAQPFGTEAGIWKLTLSNLLGFVYDAEENAPPIFVYAKDDAQVGTLELLEAGTYSSTSTTTQLDTKDIPLVGDLFKIFTNSECRPEGQPDNRPDPSLRCDILKLYPGEDPLNEFTAELFPGALIHVGPYVLCTRELADKGNCRSTDIGKTVFDLLRHNPDCEENGSQNGCGGINPVPGVLFSSVRLAPTADVPTPGTLALLGLGLLGLRLQRVRSRRSQTR